MTLFREGRTSLDIARDLNGSWPLENDAIGDELKAGIIRKVLETLVSPEDRRLMNSIKHSVRAEKNHASQNEGRDRVMRENGMKVWTAEEKEFFKSLLEGETYLRAEQKKTKRQGARKRRKHYNHVALAAAMNERFDTTEFTPERTMSRLDQLRVQERMKDPAARLSKLRANVRRKLDQAVSVTPLVVVPTERLHEAF